MAKGKREDLSKRGKIGETYRSGKFKGKKAADLSKAQLKRATTARGKKVSQKAVTRATKAKNMANISDTQFVKGKGVMKGGKLFTGQVKLASGKTATYVKGRRVVAGKKSAGGGTGGGGKGSNIPTTRVTPQQRQENARRTPESYNRQGAEGPRQSIPRNGTSGGSGKANNAYGKYGGPLANTKPKPGYKWVRDSKAGRLKQVKIGGSGGSVGKTIRDWQRGNR